MYYDAYHHATQGQNAANIVTLIYASTMVRFTSPLSSGMLHLKVYREDRAQTAILEEVGTAAGDSMKISACARGPKKAVRERNYPMVKAN
jgi:hypothetical protein